MTTTAFDLKSFKKNFGTKFATFESANKSIGHMSAWTDAEKEKARLAARQHWNVPAPAKKAPTRVKKAPAQSTASAPRVAKASKKAAPSKGAAKKSVKKAPVKKAAAKKGA